VFSRPRGSASEIGVISARHALCEDKIRDRLFVDGRRPSLSRLPDFRQVATGHDRQEARCHLPIKALPAAAGKSSYGRGPRASMQEARGRFDASRCGN
jgi:hypothetical protein